MTHTFLIDQPYLDSLCPIAEAVEKLANDSSIEERGAVFTNRAVVQFILDLVGYTSDKPLSQMRLLEPSFGGGEFLLAAVERLMLAFKAAGCIDDLTDCIRAVELHKKTFATTKTRLLMLLSEFGLKEAECVRLTSAWLISADFLLSPIAGRFDFVIGNPPYVRQEMIPSALLSQYRKLYTTIYDRADLYVPFIERSLNLLSAGGQLAFICANRWIKNKYGGPLRALISKQFHLRAYVDMEGVSAFDSNVIAYPAITLIERSEPGVTAVATCSNIDTESLETLAKALRLGKINLKTGISVVESVGLGSEPWVLSSSDKRALLRRMEALFPTLEEAGCKVGIGVATGADKAFIGMMDDLDVEPSRKLPLVTTKDIGSGEVRWQGLGVVNPFEDDGKLADLRHYPKLRAHLERNHAVIAGRHVAQKTPANWYRTIDRITPSLASRPKLLVPDIKGSAHVVFENGSLYPHHNLYFVVSEEWDLRALQAVLLSSVARQFVTAYSTTMRGGFLRFQAQYLRRIRLPEWKSVAKPLRARLVKAATELNLIECDQAAYDLYGLTSVEANMLAYD